MTIKKNSLFILIGSLSVICCKQNNSEKLNANSTNQVVTESKKSIEKINTYEPGYYDYQNTGLQQAINDTVFAKFSNDLTEDYFTLSIAKGKIVGTKVNLKITNKKGIIIYEHIFPTTELINGYDTETIKNDLDMEKYIISQAKTIFSKGLVNPKKLSTEDYLNQSSKEDFDNYDVFEEIKLSNRNIFIYGLNEENLYFLGYSKKENKTVEIISCC